MKQTGLRLFFSASIDNVRRYANIDLALHEDKAFVCHILQKQSDALRKNGIVCGLIPLVARTFFYVVSKKSKISIKVAAHDNVFAFVAPNVARSMQLLSQNLIIFSSDLRYFDTVVAQYKIHNAFLQRMPRRYLCVWTSEAIKVTAKEPDVSAFKDNQ